MRKIKIARGKPFISVPDMPDKALYYSAWKSVVREDVTLPTMTNWGKLNADQLWETMAAILQSSTDKTQIEFAKQTLRCFGYRFDSK